MLTSARVAGRVSGSLSLPGSGPRSHLHHRDRDRHTWPPCLLSRARGGVGPGVDFLFPWGRAGQRGACQACLLYSNLTFISFLYLDLFSVFFSLSISE